MAHEAGGRGGGASRVFAGILLSRLAGFLRDRAVAHYFGVGLHADVFRTALRGPNILQNLLGEGTLSAAFVPTYSRLLAAGREPDASRFAGAILGLLTVLVAALTLGGVLLARPLVMVFVPGFRGDARFDLTVTAVRLIFPMTGLLVLSAWALGVLNSHRRFLLPYTAPMLWNGAMIVALTAAAGSSRDHLLVAVCVGALAGGVLQLAVQLPLVFRLMPGFRPSLSARVDGVATALRAFGPALAGRGVVQLSAWLDLFLASFLAQGAIAALGAAQTLYMLPVSLFGMSVAAAELPELARAGGAVDQRFLDRVGRSLRRMSLLTVPTAVGYLAFGFLVVGALYRTGDFGADANLLVYLVLAGYSLGLVATTSSRLLQNVFYALGDTRPPARIAALRVAVSTVAALALMARFDRETLPGSSLRLGALAFALASAAGGWVEMAVLGRALHRRVPGLALPLRAVVAMAGLALVAAAIAGPVWWLLPSSLHIAATAAVVVGTYATIYLALARLAGFDELDDWLGRLRRR